MIYTTSRSLILINKNNLAYNLRQVRSTIRKQSKIICIVKGNAYGHGLEQIVKLLEVSDNIDWYGVDSLEEALIIRKLGSLRSILVMGYLTVDQMSIAISEGISFAIFDDRVLRAKFKNRKAKVHIKIETGLNRLGINGKDLLELVKKIKVNKNIVIEGAYTHLANVEDTLDISFAMSQIVKFKFEINTLHSVGIYPSLIHTSASAAAILYKKLNFSAIRMGIALYGLWPSRETRIALKMKKMKFNMRPVMSWVSKIAQIKSINTGESVGYGRAWFAPRKSIIGVIPIGYFDGYNRLLSNKGCVLINGKRSQIVGRVAMNMFMVDLTDTGNISQGDEVVLIGKQGNEEITVDEIAESCLTINYEFITRINSNIKRVIV